MSNSVNFSFTHRPASADERVNATVAKRNGVLDFKSILLTAEDGTLDDAKASEKEAIRQLIANRAGAVDFLKSRNIFDLNGFAPGTDAVTAANMLLEAESKGAPLQLRPQPVATGSVVASLGTPPSMGQTVINTEFQKQLNKALETLQDKYGLFDLKDFPPRINAVQALNYVESGYLAVAKAEVEQTYKTTGLAVLQKFAEDFPSLKRLLNSDQSQLKPGVQPEVRALQVLKEEDAAKATLLQRFKIDFDKLDPAPTGTAIAMLRRQLGGVELPSAIEAKAAEDLKKKLGNTDQAVNNLLARFPSGTTASQVLDYWELTTPGFSQPNAALPQPPAPGTNLDALLNRLAANELIKKDIFNLKAFPPNTTTGEAWRLVKGGGSITPVSEVPSLQGPRVEGSAGILKIRTPKAEMAKLTPPKAVEAPAVLLKGFDVVNQLVQWRVQLKDPTQLASLSQQGVTRDALRNLTQPIPQPPAASQPAPTPPAA